MKNRIIAFLSLLFIIFTIGAAISMLYITLTTAELKKIITLHSVEILRQDLIIKLQNVEQDLLTVHTELSRRLDKIITNVTDLDKAINNCMGCHHSPAISEKLLHIRDDITKFETSLSYYITASANEERIKSLKADSYNIATELLNVTSEMALIANQRLQERTQKAIDDVRYAQRILIVTLFVSFFMALWIAVNLTKNIINPIRELIDVSRKIASGNLGYTTAYSDSTEFGELAYSINDMSISLKDSNEKAAQHLNRLAGLYRVTLPFHSVSNITDIYRELSYGVADLLDVEQCGLLILNEGIGSFEHAYPAYGLDENRVHAVRVLKEDMLQLYFSCNRKPLIINEPESVSLPEGIIGDSGELIHNILLGWVRLKGELIGVIRLANKRNGCFLEESARLIGIISNNVSVAIENTKLYEDLRAQMKELKETQEQLVQAAKLAAIGELASNVAHEINNPRTSIMGYAELIKEETNIENIMSDIAIIEKESVRARDIVQQLLEFARRRPLEVKEVDINNLIREVTTLINVQLKDARIRIAEDYTELPSIVGDPNQLKQVFLNIINNSVHAMSENGRERAAAGNSREITIRTGRTDANVFVEIADNGHGISSDILPRIFEPFFTTKREKGTGLGLSISYKIIQSHKGRIDVKSEEGKGTRFTISLPLHAQDVGNVSSPA
ncbi:MAG: HAMP domain-containing protein [Nitrospirae bacterium]|nr:HAMP domain-containing protein [Nitrospirota bacterium]